VNNNTIPVNNVRLCGVNMFVTVRFLMCVVKQKKLPLLNSMNTENIFFKTQIKVTVTELTKYLFQTLSQIREQDKQLTIYRNKTVEIRHSTCFV
jgi:hypothetical protein